MPTCAACAGSRVPAPQPPAASGHGAPVFTDDLLAFQSARCKPAASLRHVAGSPGLGLLRRLRPVPAPSADDCACPPARGRGRATPGRFPRSLPFGRRDRRPAFPLQPRHDVRRSPSAAAPRPAMSTGRRSRREILESRAHRCPAHIHRVGAGSELEGVPSLVHCSLRRSVLLAAPAPSGSADPSRRCRGCSHPHPQLRDQAAPSFTRPLRQPGGGVSHPARSNSASWRTTGFQ